MVGEPFVSSKELAEVTQRAAVSLLAPLDSESLISRHLRILLTDVVSAYKRSDSEESAKARQTWMTWRQMRQRIEKAPNVNFQKNSYKGVHSEIKQRLASFQHDDFLGGRAFKFRFEVESDSKRRVRILLRREPDPKRAPIKRSKLPAPLADFQGREAELNLAAELLRRHPGLSISGFPGGGKTEFTVVLARQMEEEFSGGVFFLPAAKSSEEILRGVLMCLGVGTSSEPPLLRHQFLAAAAHSRTLFVVDDLVDELDLSELRPPPGCSMLFVSVRAIEATWLANLVIDEFTTDESRRFLLQHVDRLLVFLDERDRRALPLDDLQRIEIAERRTVDCADAVSVFCGHLPSALFATVQAFSDHEFQPLEYIRGLSVRKLDGITTLRQVGILQRLNACYRSLTTDSQAALRRIVACGGSVSEASLRVIVSEEIHPGINDLVSRRLLRFEPTTKQFFVSKLLQAYVATMLSEAEIDEGRAALSRHLEVVCRARLLDSGPSLEAEGNEALLRCLLWLEPDRDEHKSTFVTFLGACLDGKRYSRARAFHDDHERNTLLSIGYEIAGKLSDTALRLAFLRIAAPAFRDAGFQGKAGQCKVEAIEVVRKSGDAKTLGLELWSAIEFDLLPYSLNTRLRYLLERYAFEEDLGRARQARRIGLTQAYLGLFSEASATFLENETFLPDDDGPFRPDPSMLRSKAGFFKDRAIAELLSGDPASANSSAALAAAIFPRDSPDFKGLTFGEDLHVSHLEVLGVRAEAAARFGDRKMARGTCAEALREIRQTETVTAGALLAVGRALFALSRHQLAVRFLRTVPFHPRSSLLQQAVASLVCAKSLFSLGTGGQGWSEASNAESDFTLLESPLSGEAASLARCWESSASCSEVLRLF